MALRGSSENGVNQVYEDYLGLLGSQDRRVCQVLPERRGPGDLRVGLEMKDPKGYRAHQALQVSQVLMEELENLGPGGARGPQDLRDHRGQQESQAHTVLMDY